jgi:hypothetical protein
MSLGISRQALLGTFFAGTVMFTPSSYALFEDDYHISSDQDNINVDLDRRTFREIKHFIDQGYPDQSIFLHGVGLGISIDDLVYLTAQADPENAERHAQNAIDMLPSLPGWACREGRLTADSRFAKNYTADQLEPVNSIEEIAQRFFENNQRLTPFPEWTGNQFHATVNTNELADHITDEFWYFVGRNDRPVNEGVMVSLYRHENRIVVDGNLGQVRRAQEAGQQTMPVVIIYNEDYQRPISAFGEDPQLDEVVEAFFDEETQVTLVPNWKGPYADFHTLTSIEDLEEFVDLPEKEDIDEEYYKQLVTELKAKGFEQKPVLVTLYNNDRKVWVDNPARVRAAKEMGFEQVPLAYLYHSLDRLPCGVTPGDNCRDRIRRAAGLARESQPSPVRAPPPPPPSEGGNPSPS